MHRVSCDLRSKEYEYMIPLIDSTITMEKLYCSVFDTSMSKTDSNITLSSGILDVTWLPL